VSNIYLIRHGQAGTRDQYDALSDLGRKQSRLLGEYFALQGVKFVAAYAGELVRQRQTAEAASAAYGREFPDIAEDPGWNEFDLERMYREIAPQLCATNADFRREYETMRQQVHASGGAQEARVHRRWLPCDNALVNAWIAGQHDYAGETWEQFLQRVVNCRIALDHVRRNDNIAVFTSALPVAIWTGLALDIRDRRVMKLAGALQNASFTVLHLRDDNLRLFSFNNTSHLASGDVRSFR
jgi:broad specificity phosphatase PhoE